MWELFNICKLACKMLTSSQSFANWICSSFRRSLNKQDIQNRSPPHRLVTAPGKKAKEKCQRKNCTRSRAELMEMLATVHKDSGEKQWAAAGRHTCQGRAGPLKNGCCHSRLQPAALSPQPIKTGTGLLGASRTVISSTGQFSRMALQMLQRSKHRHCGDQEGVTSRRLEEQGSAESVVTVHSGNEQCWIAEQQDAADKGPASAHVCSVPGAGNENHGVYYRGTSTRKGQMFTMNTLTYIALYSIQGCCKDSSLWCVGNTSVPEDENSVKMTEVYVTFYWRQEELFTNTP